MMKMKRAVIIGRASFMGLISGIALAACSADPSDSSQTDALADDVFEPGSTIVIPQEESASFESSPEGAPPAELQADAIDKAGCVHIQFCRHPDDGLIRCIVDNPNCLVIDIINECIADARALGCGNRDIVITD